jgi:aminoglycoside phosphotransferase (APT) family kinase protein
MLPSADDRAVAAVAEHAPAYRDLPRTTLGAGLDHHALRFGDLVVRVGTPGAAVTREAALLRLVARRIGLAVPEPRFADPVRGVLAYGLLPGRPLLGRTPPTGAAAQLGHMLAKLHAVDPGEVGDLAPVEPAEPADWLRDLDGPAALLRVVRAAPPPAATEQVLAHADLGAEHLLAVEGRLTGVIDWSDAAVTDPALDFARLYRDFGPAFLDAALNAYRRSWPAFRRRITFFARCAALEDLAYGHPTYARAARRSLTWLFADQSGHPSPPGRHAAVGLPPVEEREDVGAKPRGVGRLRRPGCADPHLHRRRP